MPQDNELQSIVANMVANGESEDNIKLVIENYDNVASPKSNAPSPNGGGSGAQNTPYSSLESELSLKSWTTEANPLAPKIQAPLAKPIDGVEQTKIVQPKQSADLLKARINVLDGQYKKAIKTAEETSKIIEDLDAELNQKKAVLEANPSDQALVDDFNLSVNKRNELAGAAKKEMVRADVIQKRIGETEKNIDNSLGNWESAGNSLSNVAVQLQGFLPKTELSISTIQNKLVGGAAKAYAKMKGMSDEEADNISNVVAQASSEYGSKLNPLIFDAKKTQQAAFKTLDKLQEDYKPTKSIIETAKQKDIKGLAAAIFDGGTSVLGTFITGAPTFGTGIYTEMVGDAIYNYNKEKAKSLGMSVDELYNQNKDEVAIPATIGAIAGKMEDLGLKGISNAINKNIAKKGVKELGNFLLEGGKEAWTEWVQTGLEEYNTALGKGLSVLEAGEAAWNTMASEKGLEAALKGAGGSAVSIATGKAAKALWSGLSNSKKVELKSDLDKVQALAADAQNPELDDETYVALNNEISSTTENIKNEAVQNLKSLINLTDENRKLVSQLDSEQEAIDKDIATKKTLIDNPNLKPETKAILQSEIIALEVKKMELAGRVDEVVKNNAAIALKKNTSPTNEKYGTVNRNDGKGIVDLTKEEYLKEEGKGKTTAAIETNTKVAGDKIVENETTPIVDKKADIERRRQEELKEEEHRTEIKRDTITYTDHNGDNVKASVIFYKDGTGKIIYFDLNGEVLPGGLKLSKDNVKNKKSNSIELLKDDESSNFKLITSQTENLDTRLQDRINAKYDAELKALEEQSKSNASLFGEVDKKEKTPIDNGKENKTQEEGLLKTETAGVVEAAPIFEERADGTLKPIEEIEIKAKENVNIQQPMGESKADVGAVGETSKKSEVAKEELPKEEVANISTNNIFYQGIPKGTASMQAILDENGNTLFEGSLDGVEKFKKENKIDDTKVNYVDLDRNNPNSLLNKFLGNKGNLEAPKKQIPNETKNTEITASNNEVNQPKGDTKLTEGDTKVEVKQTVNKKQNGTNDKTKSGTSKEVAGNSTELKKPSLRGKTPKAQRKIKDKRYLEALSHETDDLEFLVMQHFIAGGEINASAIDELFGRKETSVKEKKNTEAEKRERIGLLGKTAPSINQLAHKLWENPKVAKMESTVTDQDFRNAIETVLKDYPSKLMMVNKLNQAFQRDNVELTPEQEMQRKEDAYYADIEAEYREMVEEMDDADAEAMYNAMNTPEFEADTKAYFDELYGEKTDGETELKYNEKGQPLAPNGKPSNLSEIQSKIVATKPFKKWFKGSVVVDENNEPLVVYHGTKQNFTEFKYTKDIGYHFGSKEQAEYRSVEGKLLPFFLNAKKIVEVNDVFTENGWLQLGTELVKKGILSEFEINDIYDNNIGARMFEAIKNKLLEKGIDGLSYINKVEAREFNKKSYVIFEKNKAKIADGRNVVFDENSNDFVEAPKSANAPKIEGEQVKPKTAKEILNEKTEFYSKGENIIFKGQGGNASVISDLFGSKYKYYTDNPDYAKAFSLDDETYNQVGSVVKYKTNYKKEYTTSQYDYENTVLKNSGKKNVNELNGKDFDAFNDKLKSEGYDVVNIKRIEPLIPSESYNGNSASIRGKEISEHILLNENAIEKIGEYPTTKKTAKEIAKENAINEPKNATDVAKIFRNLFNFSPKESVWAARLFDAKATFMAKIKGISKEDYYKEYWFDNKGEGGLGQIIGEQGAMSLDNNDNKGRLSKLSKAKKMESDGVLPEIIWRETGWERGADGKWKMEITPVKIKQFTESQEKEFLSFLNKNKIAETELENFVDISDLKKAYPNVDFSKLNIAFIESKDDNMLGVLMDNKNGEKDLIINYKKFIKNGRIDYVELRKTIVHEIQHFAQRQEGFGAGSNYKRAEKQIQEDRARILEKERTSGLTPLENVEKDFLNNETSDLRYWRTSGEVEARNIEKRMSMSEKDRMLTQPKLTEDVSRDFQYVYFDKGSELNQDRKGSWSKEAAKMKRLISMYSKADSTTVVHEILGHDFLDRLIESNQEEDLKIIAEEYIKATKGKESVADVLKALKEFNVETNPSPKGTEIHEWFARQAEAYFATERDVKTETPQQSKMARIFEAFRQHLSDLYNQMNKALIAPSEPMKKVFRKVFGEENFNEAEAIREVSEKQIVDIGTSALEQNKKVGGIKALADKLKEKGLGQSEWHQDIFDAADEMIANGDAKRYNVTNKLKEMFPAIAQDIEDMRKVLQTIGTKGELRQGAENLLANPNISDDVKEKIADFSEYTPETFKEAGLKADAIIDFYIGEHGLKGGMDKLHADLRAGDFANSTEQVVIQQSLIGMYNKLAASPVSEAIKKDAINKAVDVAEMYSKQGTTLGRQISAYRLLGALTAEGRVVWAQRQVNKFVKPAYEGLKKEIRNLKSELKDAYKQVDYFFEQTLGREETEGQYNELIAEYQAEIDALKAKKAKEPKLSKPAYKGVKAARSFKDSDLANFAKDILAGGLFQDMDSLTAPQKLAYGIMERKPINISEFAKAFSKYLGKKIDPKELETLYTQTRDLLIEKDLAFAEGLSTNEQIKEDLAGLEEANKARIEELERKKAEAQAKKDAKAKKNDKKEHSEQLADFVVNDVKKAIKGTIPKQKTYLDEILKALKEKVGDIVKKGEKDKIHTAKVSEVEAIKFALDAINNGGADANMWNDAVEQVKTKINQDSELSQQDKDDLNLYLNDYTTFLYDNLLSENKLFKVIKEKLIQNGYGSNGTVNWRKLIVGANGDVAMMRQELQDVLKNQLQGYDDVQVTKVLDAIVYKYEKAINEKRKEIAEKYVTDSLSQTRSQKKKTQAVTGKIGKLIIENRLGILDDYNNDILNELAKAKGLNPMTTEDWAKVRELSENVENSAEGILKNEALEELTAFVASKQPLSWMNTASAIRFAGLLGRPLTILKNLFGNTIEGGLLAGGRTIRGDFNFIKESFKGTNKGGFNDILLGGGINQSSKTSVEVNNTGMPYFRALEYGKRNAFVQSGKVVSRILDATDSVFQEMFSSAYDRVYLEKFLKLENPNATKAEIEQMVNDTFRKSKFDEFYPQALQDVIKSGKKPTPANVKRRTYEILRESQIPQSVVAMSDLESTEKTFKSEFDDNKGLATVLGDYFAKGVQLTKLPVKAIVKMVIKKTTKQENYNEKRAEDIAEKASQLVPNFLMPFTRGVSNIIEKGLEKEMVYGLTKSLITKWGINKMPTTTIEEKMLKARAEEKVKDLASTAIFTGIITYGIGAAIALAGDDDDEEKIGLKGNDLNKSSVSSNSSAKERAEQENVLKVFGHKIPLSLLGSAGIAMGVDVNIYEALTAEADNTKVKDSNFSKGAATLIDMSAKVALSFMQNSFLMSTNENKSIAEEVIKGNYDKAINTIENNTINYIGSYMLWSGFVNQSLQGGRYLSGDKTYQEAKTLSEKVQKQMGLAGITYKNPKPNYMGRPLEATEVNREGIQGFFGMFSKGDKPKVEKWIEDVGFTENLTKRKSKQLAAFENETYVAPTSEQYDKFTDDTRQMTGVAINYAHANKNKINVPLDKKGKLIVNKKTDKAYTVSEYSNKLLNDMSNAIDGYNRTELINKIDKDKYTKEEYNAKKEEYLNKLKKSIAEISMAGSKATNEEMLSAKQKAESILGIKKPSPNF